jgi:hypothetical protein
MGSPGRALCCSAEDPGFPRSPRGNMPFWRMEPQSARFRPLGTCKTALAARSWSLCMCKTAAAARVGALGKGTAPQAARRRPTSICKTSPAARHRSPNPCLRPQAARQPRFSKSTGRASRLRVSFSQSGAPASALPTRSTRCQIAADARNPDRADFSVLNPLVSQPLSGGHAVHKDQARTPYGFHRRSEGSEARRRATYARRASRPLLTASF